MSTRTAPDTAAPAPETPTGALRRELAAGTLLTTLGALALALLVGAVLIVVADEYTRSTFGYFFAAPLDAVRATTGIVADAYGALFTGSVFDPGGATFTDKVAPLSETLVSATPLIGGGLAVAAAFRAGLFNIGAEGQMIVGAAAAGYVGFAVQLPVLLHLVVAVAVGVAAGALWAGIAGWLKARTGAHEVITTIMLNYIALSLLAYLLSTDPFQRRGSNLPRSPEVAETSALPRLPGDLRVHLGILLVLGAAALFWWVFARSTIGFKFRAVGANPHAARTAGIDVDRVTVAVMLLAGAFTGLAGASLVLGAERYLTPGISAGIGFDAITVALLGRATPVGTVLAGLLFGAFDAGSVSMESATGVPRDVVSVIQALIVLFIAAPALVRAVLRFRTRARGIDLATSGWSG
ncbi:MAG: ABC transporter permease [Actinomycetota bacterium]|nr:ABC transporter permease [Actinomycetota bacterium]